MTQNNDTALLDRAEQLTPVAVEQRDEALKNFHAAYDHESLIHLSTALLRTAQTLPIVGATITEWSEESDSLGRFDVDLELGYQTLVDDDPDEHEIGGEYGAVSVSSLVALDPISDPDLAPTLKLHPNERILSVEKARTWLHQQIQTTNPEAS